jgi:conjugal transfer pilin signal peptidase TrbI
VKQRRLRPWVIAALVVVICLLMLLCWQPRYQFGLNAGQSLPGRLYLIERDRWPERGDLVAFRWNGGGPYPSGVTFVKQVTGVPGDRVVHHHNQVWVHGQPIGGIKTHARDGSPLDPGPTGTVPDGHWFVSTPHPDSLDSRYALTGWIARGQLIGRAHALF